MSVQVTRIHLKTDIDEAKASREELIDFCLKKREEQYVAIGWSYVCVRNGEQVPFADYREYYDAVRQSVKEDGGRLNAALNVFMDTKEGDLFWTRDMDGQYWICRARGGAQPVCTTGLEVQRILALDIGAVVPVEAYQYGISVPGAVKASFNRARGGIVARFWDDLIIKFSEYAFNVLSGKNAYELETSEEMSALSKGNFIRNLPDFDLEELVMSYIQIKYDMYLLSNSIANRSTTVRIEGEFISRTPENFRKAVVQVKGPGWSEVLSANEFREFLKEGYMVFLYANHCDTCDNENVVWIKPDDLIQFYNEYKAILPKSITQWENIFA